ncbi:hypothetical protein CCP2SC5_430026 [Azospirillaceae bacterium]
MIVHNTFLSSDKPGAPLLRLERLEIASNVDRIALDRTRDLIGQAVRLVQSPPDVGSELLKEVKSAWSRLSQPNLLIGDVTWGWEIEGLSLATKEGLSIGRLKNARAQSGALRLDAPYAEITGVFGWEDVEVGPGLGLVDPSSVPRTLAIEVGLRQLPLIDMLSELANNVINQKLPEALSNPNKGQREISASVESKISGLILDVKQFKIETPHYALDAFGQAVLREAAQYGGFGNFDVTLRGVEPMVRTIATTLSEPLDPIIAPVLAILGQREERPDGVALHHYRFALSENGVAIFNGNDVSALLPQAKSLIALPMAANPSTSSPAQSKSEQDWLNVIPFAVEKPLVLPTVDDPHQKKTDNALRNRDDFKGDKPDKNQEFFDVMEFTAGKLQNILSGHGFPSSIKRNRAGNPRVTVASGADMPTRELQFDFYDCNDAGACLNLMMWTWVTPQQPVLLEAINDWNRHQRWSRVYVDSDRDVRMEWDVRANGGLNQSNLEAYIDEFIKLTPKFVRRFSGVEKSKE